MLPRFHAHLLQIRQYQCIFLYNMIFFIQCTSISLIHQYWCPKPPPIPSRLAPKSRPFPHQDLLYRQMYQAQSANSPRSIRYDLWSYNEFISMANNMN